MATPLPPRDHRISRSDAERIVGVRRRADGNPDASTGARSGAASDAGARREQPFAFHRTGIERLLAQAGCAGVRAYPARHDDGSNTWVLVGVDEAGNDMTGGELAQEPYICPPYCPDELLGANA